MAESKIPVRSLIRQTFTKTFTNGTTSIPYSNISGKPIAACDNGGWAYDIRYQNDNWHFDAYYFNGNTKQVPQDG